MRVQTGILFFLLLTAGFLTAEPGGAVPFARTKSVNHLVRFEGIQNFARNYRFYAVGFGRGSSTFGSPEQRRKKPVAVFLLDTNGELHYGHISPVWPTVRLCAVPRDWPLKANGEPKEEWFANPTKGVLESEPIDKPVRAAPGSDPHDTYLTRYQVSITRDSTGARLTLSKISSGWVEPKATAWDGFLFGTSLFPLFALSDQGRSWQDAGNG